MNYNSTIEVVETRKNFRVRDEVTGKCLEIDCDFHVAKDLGTHCKKLNKDFDERTFVSLWEDWWRRALSPSSVLQARQRLVEFINNQERKDVIDNLKGLYNFYSKEGERVLHCFRDPQANLAEVLGNKDNMTFGEVPARVGVCSTRNRQLHFTVHESEIPWGWRLRIS